MGYGDEVIKLPGTPEGWKEVTRGFEEWWHLPTPSIEAIDGAHFQIMDPPQAGYLDFNYKLFYSLVLLSVVDADYTFLHMNVGAFSSESDSSVFER